MLLAPLLVLGGKGLLRQATDALAMPKGGDKVHPLLATIGTGWTGKQAVCVWKSGVQQGDQVVFQHGLYFGILLVLPVAGLQHEPGSVFISESRLGDMYVLNKDNSGKVTLNGGYSSGLKLKTGELIRVVDGFNPDQTSSFVGAQFGVILSENKSGIYYFGKDYFTFWYDINKDLLELTHGYGCSTKNELLIERCGLYGHDGACTSLIVCNGWKIPDYYPIRF